MAVVFACAAGADAYDEAPGGGCEPEHQRPLAIVQGQAVALLEAADELSDRIAGESVSGVLAPCVEAWA